MRRVSFSAKFDHRARQHAGKEMVEIGDGLRHGLDDLGMRVPENGAHLAGGEIEYGAAIRVIDEAALGALDDDGRKMPAIADQFVIRALPELRVAICTHSAAWGRAGKPLITPFWMTSGA